MSNKVSDNCKLSYWEPNNMSLLNAIENIEDSIYTLDNDYRFIYINNTALKTINKSREELIGNTIWEVSPHILNHPFSEKLKHSFDKQEICELNEYFPFTSNWYKVNFFPSNNSITIIYKNITEIKKAKEDIERSLQELKFLADSIPQLVWTTLPDGTSDYYNNRWNEYLGYDPLIKKIIDWDLVIHPDEAKISYNLWRKALAEGKVYETEYRIKGADGTYRWFIARALPIKDNEGKILKWFGTATDINEHKKNQNTQKFLSEASAQLISTIDYNETIKNIADMAVPYFADWSSADFFDTQDNSIKRLAVAHSEPEKIQLAYELLQKYPLELDMTSGVVNVIKTGKSEYIREITDEMLVIACEGDDEKLKIVRDLGLKSCIIVPIFNRGKSVGALSFVTSESNRLYEEYDLQIAEDLAKRASLAIDNAILYKELNKQKEELERFAYAASHDLSEPLRTISTYTQLIERKYKKNLDTDAEKLFEVIISGTKRMRTLIDNLLSYSKIGSSIIKSKAIDLNKIIEIVKNNLQALIKENNANIIYNDLPIIKGDETLITILFQNIISNGIKYRRDIVPEIKIHFEKRNNEYLFKVSDNGIGIAQENFDKVFVVFQRIKEKCDVEGSGIGLATCQKIIDLHNGKIWIQSEQGQGTDFYFTIPYIS